MTGRNAPRVITEPLGGSSLARAAVLGSAPEAWYARRPRDVAEWAERVRDVAASAEGDWIGALGPAFSASGAAMRRLDAVANGKGVVVTTGQQPGLFGGPMYTWSKALSAIALADALQVETGVPTAPVFWAATDDSDFAEASWTMIARSGGAEMLRLPGDHTGVSMASVPLGDVSALLAALAQAAGSAAWRDPLQMVRNAYGPEETIGSAYVRLLRAMLEPLGMAVLDAAHPAVRKAGSAVLREALTQSEAVAARLADRDGELTKAGHTPQVANVSGLTLVFRADGAARQRIRHEEAHSLASALSEEALSPNVLLRPVMERAILPTVAYVAGPAEIAYFAQVGVVADTVGAARPLAVPRWSCTIIEPHVAEILERLGLTREELQDPHAAETRLATAALPRGVAEGLAHLEQAIDGGLTALQRDDATLIDARALDGARKSLTTRLARLQRRYTAAAKRRMADTLRDVGTARGSLYPGGKRQERALNLVPLLARYGEPLLADMRVEANAHASALLHPPTGAPAAAVALGATSPAK